jgi:hypothetical protein
VTLWLFGDSIFAGAAFQVKVKPRHPAWPVRAPGPMIELMLGEPCTRLGGSTAIPAGVEEAAAIIEAMVGRDIGPDDVIVMLDVGVHSFDPDLHERQWLQLRAATRAHPGLTLICEGFDFGALGRRRKVHTKPIRGGRSANDAVRAAAIQPMRQAGRTAFVPTSKPLLRYHHALARLYEMGAGWSDGVHLNVWGQGRLCWLVLEALGRADAGAMARWRSFAEANWSVLQAPDAAAAGRIAEMACEPSDSLYGAERAATARGAAS